MRLLRTEVSRYASLLIILFSLAALAVHHTMIYFEARVPYIPFQDYRLLAILLWVLTLGFMLIAGAFGLWGMNVSAEAESRRRVGLLVDAMDYIDDGVMLLDKDGHVNGSNPVARNLAIGSLDERPLVTAVFPCLAQNDIAILTTRDEPQEIERDHGTEAQYKTLRFRSLPSGNLTLVLISDITSMNELRARRRHAARLELIGQIARGVADDFTDLLCGISCNAALLPRLDRNPEELQRTVESIANHAERGIALAASLQRLAGTSTLGQAVNLAHDHIRLACDGLRDGLSTDWTVTCEIRDELPPVGLSHSQIEQIVINLGLLAAEMSRRPGTLQVVVSKPGRDHITDVGSRYAGVILVTATDTLTTVAAGEAAPAHDAREATGVIQSVVRSMLTDSGGALDCLRQADGSALFRIILPRGTPPVHDETRDILPEELRMYVTNWRVLLAGPEGTCAKLENELNALDIQVEVVSTIVKALGGLDDDRHLDAIIFDHALLRDEPRALLHAVIKLRPGSAIVVLTEEGDDAAEELRSDIHFVTGKVTTAKLITGMVEARHLAVRRTKANVS